MPPGGVGRLAGGRLAPVCLLERPPRWCQVSADNLGLHRQRIFETLTAPWVAWFAWRYGEPHYTLRQDTGRISRGVNRYKVALDDPLVPADAEHLVNWLAETAGGMTGDPLERALAAVKRAIESPRGELLAPTPGPAQTAPEFYHFPSDHQLAYAQLLSRSESSPGRSKP